MSKAPDVCVSWMGRPKVARGARGRPAHPILFLFDVPSMQPWSAQSKPCEGVRASKEMNLGVTRYDGKTGFIWANPRFKVIRAFERLIILIILIN